jgi:hypothetical protein
LFIFMIAREAHQEASATAAFTPCSGTAAGSRVNAAKHRPVEKSQQTQ